MINQELLIDMVDDFLKPFGVDSDFSSDFSYDPEDDRVYFSLLIGERQERLFRKYVQEKFNYTIPNIFMLTLLHEVGHAYTFFSFSKDEIRTARRAKEHLEKELKRNNIDSVYIRYFDLPIEKVATEWAIAYYKKHTRRCENFWSKFKEILQEEYNRLGVTE